METKPRSPILAGLASLVLPGLGQLYNGQPLLGLALLAGCYGLSILWVVRYIGALGGPDPVHEVGQQIPWLAASTLLWIGGVIQAIVSAVQRQDYELRSYNSGAVYVLIVLGLYVAAPFLFARPLMQWVFAQNGVDTPERQRAWLERVLAARAGRPLAPNPDFPSDLVGPVSQGPIDIPDPEVAAANAATAIHIVLVGGQHSGVYDAASAEPTCTVRRGQRGSWTSLYTNPADSLGLTAVQVGIPVESGDSREFNLSVNLGNLPSGRSYTVDSRRPLADGGRAGASVIPRGEGAVLRLTGATEEGVRLEATVQCRRVSVE